MSRNIRIIPRLDIKHERANYYGGRQLACMVRQ
jgi:hypothetical protein